MNVDRILAEKGAGILTVSSGASVTDAVKLLKAHDVGALVVSDDGHHLLGIISERDIIGGLAERGNEVLSAPVREIMTSDVVTCNRDWTGREVMEVMTDRRIRHLPVVEGGELLGIVSIGDAVKNRLGEIMHEAETLREYIVTA